MDLASFFGDEFFKNGKSGALRRIPSIDKIKETDINEIGVRLAKFWELYENEMGRDADFLQLLQSDDIKISHFGYTCNILQGNCAVLKKARYNGNSEEIKKYLDNPRYQEYVDEYLALLLKKAQELSPSSVMPASPEEQQEHQSDEAAEQAIFLGMINDLEETQTSALKKAGVAERVAADAQQIATNMQRDADNVLPNILTTLGIFVAIIIAVVACYLSLLLSQHRKEATPLNVTICLLMGHILINVICLLLYLVSKMTNFTLACHCPIGDKKDCGQCPSETRECCTWVNKIWLKYPYVVLLNSAFCLSYVGLELWNVTRKYLGDKIDEYFQENPYFVLILVVCVAAIVYFAARGLINNFRWGSSDDRLKRTIGYKVRMAILSVIGWCSRFISNVLKGLASPFRRIWSDLIELFRRRVEAQQENMEIGEKITKLEKRIEELEGQLTKVGKE